MKLFCGTIDQQLVGDSLGERYRSLNQLVLNSDPQLLASENFDSWLDKTLADRIYIAKLANHTKNAAVLCEIFKTENEMVVAIAMHATWLFNGTNNKDLINADNLVNNILAKATTHTTCRMVSLFGTYLKNEQLAEDLFLLMLPVYGRELSYKLLSACSFNFICSQITNENKIISSTQLKRIFKKYPTTITEYLKHNINNNNNLKSKNSVLFKREYVSLWTLVAEFQPEFFMSILKNYGQCFNLKLGTRVTIRFVKLYLNDIIENPSLFIQFLHRPTLIKQVKGNNLEQLCLNLLPLNQRKFDYKDVKLKIFRYFKPVFRMELLRKIYSKKYNGANFLSRLTYDDSDLLKLLPLAEMNSWAQNKIESLTHSQGIDEIDFLKYLPSDIAIPRFMFLIKNESKMFMRTNLFIEVIDCCKLNNDCDALLTILKYIIKRHRNDSTNLLNDFLNRVNDCFMLHELSKEYWENIHEIANILILNGDTWSLTSIYESEVKYCLKNGFEIDSVIQKLMDRNCMIDLSSYDPKHKVIIIEGYSKKIRKCIESSNYIEHIVDYISKMLYLYKDRSDKLQLEHSPTKCKWLIDAIEKNLPIMSAHQKLRIFSDLKNDVSARKIFSDELFKTDIKKFAENYLRHDANIIIRNTSNLLEYCLKSSGKSFFKFGRFFRRIRAYFYDSMVADLLDKIEEKCESTNDFGTMTIAYSCFQDMETIENNIKLFIPTETKINIKAHREEYNIVKFITKHVRYINPPVSFDTILSFAKDDYFKLILPSILSLASKKSRSAVLNLITDLLEKPVSVKKLGIRLAYFFIPRDELLVIYHRLWDNNKNRSIRVVIVKKIFEIVDSIDYENDDISKIWIFVKHCIESFTELDVKLFKYLNHNNINKRLYSDYRVLSWSKLKLLSWKKANVHQIMWNSIDDMTKNMQHLREDFCLSIINEYITSITKLSDKLELHRFAAKYLTTLKSERMKKTLINKVCDVLKEYIIPMWDKNDDQFHVKAIVLKFVASCCHKSLRSDIKVNPTNLLRTVHHMLSESLPFGSFIDLEINLDLSMIYQELFESTFADVSEKVKNDKQMFNQRIREFGLRSSMYVNKVLLQRYGIEINPIFLSIFKNFVKNFLLQSTSENINNLEASVITGIIDDKPTHLSFLMAIDMLPDNLKSQENYKLFHHIIKKIIDEGNVTVKMFLDKKFKLKSTDFNVKSIEDKCVPDTIA